MVEGVGVANRGATTEAVVGPQGSPAPGFLKLQQGGRGMPTVVKEGMGLGMGMGQVLYSQSGAQD